MADKGKLIVLEGIDGSGKSAQYRKLKARFELESIDCRTIVFPRYDQESSALIRMYLSGQFGANPADVGPCAASIFYAVDRYASYKSVWGDYYNAGGTVVAGRYTTSNAIHQASKLSPDKWKPFLDWLYDFEYNKIGIPQPDRVIFLDMPIEVSQRLLNRRYSEDGGKKDIHESDVEYLENCRKAALFTAEYSGWITVPCAKDGKPRGIEDISDEILERVL